MLEHETYSRLDLSLAEKAAHDENHLTQGLEAIGLDSLMRASVIKGLELFTDFGRLKEEFSHKAEDEVV